MTKGMGIMMLGLYVVFVVVTLGFNKGWYPCFFDPTPVVEAIATTIAPGV